MKPIKATLFVFVLMLPFVVGNALVHAVSPGENFKWVATVEDGVRIGGEAQEGEDFPAQDTLEFKGGCGRIDFAQDGGITFGGEGTVFAGDTVAVGAYNASQQDPRAGAVTLIAEPEGDVDTSALVISIGGPAGAASGTVVEGEGEYDAEFQASIMCTPDGDVIVDLGGAPEEDSLDGGQAEEEYPNPFDSVLHWIERKSMR